MRGGLDERWRDSFINCRSYQFQSVNILDEMQDQSTAWGDAVYRRSEHVEKNMHVAMQCHVMLLIDQKCGGTEW